VYDTVARLDIDQLLREEIAEALTEALAGRPDFKPELFRALASDPLSRCAGPEAEAFAAPCPHGREIRTGMHLSSAPDGRAGSWQMYKPVVRCVSCGASVFIPGYREAQGEVA
jgi:hypothetical protein